MPTVGLVEHLRTSQERWEFLLRLADGEAVNVELRGQIHGALREGDRVALLESREIRSLDVTVALRVRNETLRSTVTASAPTWREKAVSFIVPTSIWTPVGGLGAAGLTLVFTGRAGTQGGPTDVSTRTPTATIAAPTATATRPPAASPTASSTNGPTATATVPVDPLPSAEPPDARLAPLLVAAALLVVLAGLVALRATRHAPRAGGGGLRALVRALSRLLTWPRASELLRFGAFAVMGVLTGLLIRLVL